MFRTWIRPFLVGALACFAAAAAPAQGIELEGDAVVLFGSSATTSKPATVDWTKLRNVTPEWKTIRSQGVTKGTARYSLLISNMKKRIKRHCKSVAKDEGCDCVVREGDIADAKGLTVEDLTDSVVKLLESGDGDS